MRTIKYTTAFKRDFKREVKGRHGPSLEGYLREVVPLLAKDEALGIKYRDHSLGGNYSDHRECHLKPDLLLIYKKPDEETLWLARLGSHSELF